ncbi:helix-turn-helix domain-containing protein [Phenylobacterium sp.]|uniref:AraC family transcriptional regulator n=1 Tax=Phenylobacterium sp. TaxID=1871053 RepID=UPI0035B0E944
MLRSIARASGPANGPLAAANAPAAAEALSFQANSVTLRLQPAAAFELRHDGERPMLAFAFGAAQGEAAVEGGRPRAVSSRAETFALLRPGVRSVFRHPDPLEVLTLAYDETALADHPEPGEPSGDIADPGVRALAHEARRVLLQEAVPDRDYLEAIGQAMLARAVQVIDGGAPQRGRGLIAPFRMRRVLEHIESRLDEKISVGELAQVAGLSEAHFARAFRHTMGEAPHRFILSRRIERVRELLGRTDLDLASVAFRAGFSSHAHMTSAFHRQLGMSPAAYRAALARA